MQRTRIEWVRNPDGSQGHSWNPIQGLCPVGCWYCYARRMYQRFKRNPEIRYEGLNEPFYLKKPSTIFVCSTFEIFHPIIPNYIRDDIFNTIKGLKRHTFIVLTKLPENIDQSMPDNVWLGITIEGGYHWKKRLSMFKDKKAKIKFISYEPLIVPLFQDFVPNLADTETCLKKGWIKEYRYYQVDFTGINWLIIGRLTGFGHKYDPKLEWIEEIVNQAKKHDIPVFLKDNLKDIWPGELIQEFPRVK